jgi:hypothetical protein
MSWCCASASVGQFLTFVTMVTNAEPLGGFWTLPLH